MAITVVHNFIFSLVLDNKVISANEVSSICEIGEQNWHYRNPEVFEKILEEKIKDQPTLDYWKIRFEEINSVPEKYNLFSVARLYYEILFGDYEYLALDMHGTPESTCVDLNLPYETDKQFDLITNLGTSEHVFNQAELFRTIHKLTKRDGIIYHGLPNQGQFDHGFFNYHPAFFYDLATANDYVILLMLLLCVTEVGGVEKSELHDISKPEQYRELVRQGNLPIQSGIHAFYRKKSDKAFRFPQQGVYQQNPDRATAEYWQKYSR